MEIKLFLHDKQGLAFRSDATEVLYGGAAGGGKSHLLRVAAVSWCYAIHGLQVYLFRRLGKDLWKNHMDGAGSFPDLLAPWIGSGFAKINHSLGEIRIGKSKIHLCHCEHEKSKFQYQGAGINVLLIDELTHFTETIYAYLRSRVRLGGLEIPAQYAGMFPRIICGSNPGGIGHNWVKRAWVKPAPPLDVWRAEKGEGGMLRQFIPALLEDNPTMRRNDPEYESKLEGLGSPDLVRAMRLGDWDIVAGGMFDDVWSRDVHVLPHFDVPRTWYVDRSFDWGGSKPFSVGWWAESDGSPAKINGQERYFYRGTLVRIAEWYGCVPGQSNKGVHLPTRDIARGILEREQRMGLLGRVNDGPADPAIFGIDSDMRTTASKFEEATFAEFDGRRVVWRRANQKLTGNKKLRVQGWDLMRNMLSAARKAPMEDPGLFVMENCRDWIDVVPVLPRDPHDPEDLDTKSEDHLADESRYRLTTRRHELGEVEISGI